MTDKELKDMDETTSMDTTAAAESAAEAVAVNEAVNEAVDDALLSDVDELPFDVDFDETTKVDTASAPVPADGGADVVAANADHVNAMLSLATPRESTDDESSPTTSRPRVPPRPPRPSPPTSTVRSRSATRISTCCAPTPRCRCTT